MPLAWATDCHEVPWAVAMELSVSPLVTVYAAPGCAGWAGAGAGAGVAAAMPSVPEEEEPEPEPESEGPESEEPDEPESEDAPLFAELSVLPVFREQDGQAPMPCSALTRSATWICSARLASSGCPEPPKARQVESVNCRPPPKPLPVLMPQSPPLSHWASSSQSVSADASPVVRA